MNKQQEFIIRILSNMLGDDLHRARHAFAKCTPEEMEQEYGVSGQTRTEIIKAYEAEDAEIKQAIEWVKNAKTN